jgi:hypothetical protein
MRRPGRTPRDGGRAMAWALAGAAAALAAVGLARLRPLQRLAAAAERAQAAAIDPQNLPPARHERTDVGFRPMLIAGICMLATLGAVLVLADRLYPGSVADKRIALPLPAFPQPELQPSPALDWALFHQRQLDQLNTAWWVSRERGVVHLPVAQAMRDVAARGIPDWPR